MKRSLTELGLYYQILAAAVSIYVLEVFKASLDREILTSEISTSEISLRAQVVGVNHGH